MVRAVSSPNIIYRLSTSIRAKIDIEVGHGNAFFVDKTLKKQIKEESAALHILTKKTIENLTDDGVIELLKLKWTAPLVQSLGGLPETMLTGFAAKLDTLCKKYETTLADIERQIEDEERALTGMLDELCGNEFDMKGIEELRLLLGGSEND